MLSMPQETIDTAGLRLTFSLTPWDQDIRGAPAATIQSLEVRQSDLAKQDFARFLVWCRTHGVRFVTARLPHHQIDAVGFLEQVGFRFVELNYRPHTKTLVRYAAADGVLIRPATEDDMVTVASVAAQVFQATRFTADTRLSRDVNSQRYRSWALAAFCNPDQGVFVGFRQGTFAAFFVVERPSVNTIHWSLVAMDPALAGRGFAGDVWSTMLVHHRADGVDTVSTSISSLNVSAMNLYVSLGFSFPEPSVTLHWLPT